MIKLGPKQLLLKLPMPAFKPFLLLSSIPSFHLPVIKSKSNKTPFSKRWHLLPALTSTPRHHFHTLPKLASHLVWKSRLPYTPHGTKTIDLNLYHHHCFFPFFATRQLIPSIIALCLLSSCLHVPLHPSSSYSNSLCSIIMSLLLNSYPPFALLVSSTISKSISQ